MNITIENMIFYIYEVVGHKNGCTTEWDKRSNENFNKYGIMPVLIETYDYPDTEEYWQIVGDREWELAERNGYLKGPHYRQAREQRSAMGQSGGSKKSETKTIAARQNAALGGILGGRTIGTKHKESGQWKIVQGYGGSKQGTILHECPICGKYPLKGNGALNSHMRIHKNKI